MCCWHCFWLEPIAGSWSHSSPPEPDAAKSRPDDPRTDAYATIPTGSDPARKLLKLV